jgi:beta-glucosidase/6-phospho-beta-glucosidase/beta-galactosidase
MDLTKTETVTLPRIQSNGKHSWPVPAPALFRSYWIAGFECSCQINSHGRRLDMTSALRHDILAESDYAMLSEVGIRTARDGIRWHLVDGGADFDFSSFAPIVRAARDHGVQVIWDICHYGWPDDLDIFSAEFINRFSRFAGAVTHYLREESDEMPFFAPVNEINFFAWAATRDLMYPYAYGRDRELKRQLVRAATAAADAILRVEPRSRLVYPEPMIHNVPPRQYPDLVEPARRQHDSQYEAWDMIGGMAAPELGGEPRFLDIIGVNYYAANQWEVPGGRKLHWDAGSNDERWVPLPDLLEEVYNRYHRPIFMAETSHYGTGRAAWIKEVAQGVYAARQRGIPMEGVCLYPILDRFDWEDPTHYHNSGLFDYRCYTDGSFERVLNAEYAAELANARQLLAGIGCD